MNDVILGVDIGTTGTKAIAINSQGEILASAYQGYNTYTDHNSWAEQDAMDWWDAVINTIRECIQKEEIRQCVKGIGLSSQGGSLVPVDNQGKPLRRAITWMDQRAAIQSIRFKENNPQDYFYRTTGWKLGNGLNAVQIRWLQENEPEIFRNTYKFLSTIDFIIHQMTGEFYIDPSSAGITQLMNFQEKVWDPTILKWLDITKNYLPLIRDSGEIVGKIKPGIQEQLGLPGNVLVVTGAHDQYCAAVGAGVVESGDVLLATGTAWVVLGISDDIKPDVHSYLSQSRHAAEGKWGTMGTLGAAGKAMEWFKNNLGKTINNKDGGQTEEYGEIDRKVLDKPPGSNGLTFYPHFNGAPYPSRSSSTKGTLLGLDLNHNRYDIARALMEGVAFDTRWMLETCFYKNSTNCNLIMTGGATQSQLWPQMIADVTGMPILIPQVKHMACLGAAIIAGKAIKWFPSIIEGSHRFAKGIDRYDPNPVYKEQYQNLFQLYKERKGRVTECYK